MKHHSNEAPGRSMNKTYLKIYQAVYSFHLKFGRIPPLNRDDAYWKDVVKAMSEYLNQHSDSFSRDLIESVTAELEREYREARGIEQ